MSWEEKQNKIKKIEDIKHQRQELMDIAVRLKRGQEASYLRGNEEYKQPDVIEYIGWVDENILKFTEELEREIK